MSQLIKNLFEAWEAKGRPYQRIFDYNPDRRLKWQCIASKPHLVHWSDLKDKPIGIISTLDVEAWEITMTDDHLNPLNYVVNLTKALVQNLELKPVFDLRPGKRTLLFGSEADMVIAAAYLDQFKDEIEEDDFSPS